LLGCYCVYTYVCELRYHFQCRLPLLGEFTCQNAILAERFIEAGSPYVSLSLKLCFLYHADFDSTMPLCFLEKCMFVRYKKITFVYSP
jgi:hypothetical protein